MELTSSDLPDYKRIAIYQFNSKTLVFEMNSKDDSLNEYKHK